MNKHILPLLPYAYDALEPHFDTKTMEIHHGKHHQTYVDKLNAALEKEPALFEKPLQELLVQIESVPVAIRTAVINNGGGHLNHSFFWPTLKKGGGGEPRDELALTLKKAFGSFEVFKQEFSQAALNLFGSGWVWLVAESGHQLSIMPLPNHDSPISHGQRPILVLDLWEHAYYLKYQNRRAEYIEAWWQIVNWEQAEKNFQEVK